LAKKQLNAYIIHILQFIAISPCLARKITNGGAIERFKNKHYCLELSKEKELKLLGTAGLKIARVV